MSKEGKGDLVLPAILVVFSVIGLSYVLATFPRRERIAPAVVFLCLGVFSLVQTVKSFRSFRETEGPSGGEDPAPERLDTWGIKATWVSVIAAVVYILLIQFAGFVAASALLLVGLPVYLGYRNILVVLMICSIFIGAVYLLFSQLHVPVPTGTLWKALRALMG